MRLCLDHCHNTGAFMWWLRKKCNLALGMLGDDALAAVCLLKFLQRSMRREALLELLDEPAVAKQRSAP